jgi:putative ABC transport system permease protein
MDALRQDIRFALRGLAKSRIFTVVAVTMLALGIGVNTAVFSLVDAVAFKPLPFADADRLVDVHEWSATQLCAGCGVGTSYDGFLAWRARARSFAAMGAYTELAVAVSGAESPERITGALASAELFQVLGVRPAVGRGFTSDEDRTGGAPVVVVSDDLWRRRFGADTALLGRVIRVNGTGYTVVGIMPPRFRFPEFAELWLPFAQVAHDTPRDRRDYGVVARLRAGVTIGQADAEMRVLASALEAQYPETQREWTARVTSFRRDYAGETTQLYSVMLGAVTCVLLIVCANLAGLLLVRGAVRQKEIAIRLALGASRGQIVRQLLAESLILAFAGGAIGLLLSVWAVEFAVASLRTAVPFWIDFAVDARALTFCLVVSVGTGIVFGLVPALRASRPNVQVMLKEGGAAASPGLAKSRLRSALVVVELALALVLLAGAGVLMKAFLRISVPEAGVDAHNVLTGELEFLDARYTDRAQIATAAAGIAERVGRLPGVSSASLSHSAFLAGFGASPAKMLAEGVREVPDRVSPSFSTAVSPGYFAALRLPLRAGRLLSMQDRAGAPAVVVVNARMAHQLWPNESPLGKRIKLGPADSLPWLTIVGVVGDADAGERARNQAYVPFAQSPGRPASLLVRGAATSDVQSLTPLIRGEVRVVDRDLPLVRPQTMEQQRHQRFWPYEMYALFMASFAVLAIVLAAIGLYGLVTYAVTQRTREIGIRIALGAERRHVLLLITGQGARLVLLGTVGGILSSIVLLQALRSMIFGVSPADPGVYVTVSLLLAIVALLASYVPARRAAGVDPLIALRSE